LLLPLPRRGTLACQQGDDIPHLISQATQGRLLKRRRSAHTKPRAASGFHGVSANKKQWAAKIPPRGRYFNKGSKLLQKGDAD
jgi:hypothetical protein